MNSYYKPVKIIDANWLNILYMNDCRGDEYPSEQNGSYLYQNKTYLREFYRAIGIRGPD